MLTRCSDCGVTYDDAERWGPLWAPHDRYCRAHDLVNCPFHHDGGLSAVFAIPRHLQPRMPELSEADASSLIADPAEHEGGELVTVADAIGNKFLARIRAYNNLRLTIQLEKRIVVSETAEVR